ncbi:MAG: peptide ABC transporter ATP-binding protein, partial [Comamonadaceae bacterium]
MNATRLARDRAMTEPLLQVENLVRAYTLPREKLFAPPAKVHALNGVSF